MESELILHYGPKGDRQIKIDLAEGNVHIDGCSLTPTEWSSLKRRVDKALSRKFGEVKPPPAPTPRGTKFILKNLKTLNSVQRGWVRPAPWFLPWFEWVITKDEYGS